MTDRSSHRFNCLSLIYNLLTGIKYKGWILLEAEGSSEPDYKIAAMKEQLSIFNQLIANTGK